MFLTEPVLFPSSDEDPNFSRKVQPPLVWTILLSNGFFIPLVTIVIALRIFTKVSMTKQVFLDDYLMITSAVLFLSLASVEVAAIPFGFGLHVEKIGETVLEQVRSIEHVLYYNFISMLLVCLSICLAKLSIIATLLHIFNAKTITPMRVILLTTSLVVIACCAAQFFFVVFQCTTVRLSWMVSEIGNAGSCSNLETAVVVTGTINALTDFAITCAPIPSFMKLQMPLKQRLWLSALFLSGLIACIFGLIRVVSVQGLGSTVHAIDATYEDVAYFNWSVAEAGLCIITGSIPALRPLLATILPTFFGQFSMDEFVNSVKGTVTRVATRTGSRSRSRAGSQSNHRRRSSDGTISSLPALSQQHSYDELESPKGERARTHSIKKPQVFELIEFVSCFAAQTVCTLEKAFRGRNSGDEERGRSRLSVIEELDEITSQRGRNKQKLDNLGKLTNRIDLSASVADVRWWWARSKLNPWKSKRPAGDPPAGVIIMITEVEVHNHHKYPL